MHTLGLTHTDLRDWRPPTPAEGNDMSDTPTPLAMWGRLTDLGRVEAGEELVVKNIPADAARCWR